MLIDGIKMLPGIAEYPRDQWYVIAWSHEIEAGKMVARLGAFMRRRFERVKLVVQS